MVNKIIDNWYKAQKAGAWLPCPRCGKLTMKEDLHTNAFSRRADIYVCDKCGMAEAIEDVPKSLPIHGNIEKIPLEEWFVCKTVYNQTHTDKTYVVCVKDTYIRDATTFNPDGMSNEEFENSDIHSWEFDDNWEDCNLHGFLTIVQAESEEAACRIVSQTEDRDFRCLCAFEASSQKS